ncbi:MAG: glucokinase [Pseudomonadota bacterium]
MMADVLVGDAGGTSLRFALARRTGGAIVLDAQRKYSEVKDAHGRVGRPLFKSFDDGLAAYIEETGIDPAGRAALFAVAGPPDVDGGVEMTNRTYWPRILPGALTARFGLRQVNLVNDFAGLARSVPDLPNSDFVEILPGAGRPGAPIVVTGPGTGFGIATLMTTSTGRFVPITGQGGHAGYAAQTVREAELAARLPACEKARDIFAAHGLPPGTTYVATEMIVSGEWLKPVFDILSDMHNVERRDLSAQEILDAAEAGDPVCVETCLLRARGIMGAAGDVVLINGGQGGVVLTGGVAERMPGWLKHPEATARFLQRGSETPYMADVPVRVLMNPDAPLLGAAALLFDRLSEA